MAILFTLVLSLPLPPPCATQTLCPVGTPCRCSVPARSAGGIFFYWLIPVRRGEVVHCALGSFPKAYVLVPGGCRAPAGSRSDGLEQPGRFPWRFAIDARDLDEAQALATIKYLVPAGDMGSRSELSCARQSPTGD
ncbi:MAG: hypothetical protein EOO40_04840 [Deltaproteobacteria bacterium]|nr:MAG: hypothetical protein EOO40_04840 [Deltaproteobacteria bacterium]